MTSKLGPRNILGKDYRPGEFPAQTAYPSSAFSAFNRAFLGAVPDVARRWASLYDTKELITEQEWKEIIGDRKISTPYVKSYDRSLAEFLASEYDQQQYMAQFERGPLNRFAEFFGGMLPMMAEPVSVATLPVGGTSMKAAAEAPTLAKFLYHSLMGGAAVGAVSAPIEAALEPRFYGERRPDVIAGTALGPLIAVPVLTGLGRLLPKAGSRNVRGSKNVVDKIHPELADRVKADEMAVAVEHGETSGFPPPPETRGVVGDVLPDARLAEMFVPYKDGSPRTWVKDLVAGVPEAKEFATVLNVDTESPAFLSFLERHKEASAIRKKPTVDDMRTLDDVISYARSEVPDYDVTQRLIEAGMVKQTGDTVEVTAPFRDLFNNVLTSDGAVIKTERAQEFLQGGGRDGEISRFLVAAREEHEMRSNSLTKAQYEALTGAKNLGEGVSPDVSSALQSEAAFVSKLQEEITGARSLLKTADGAFPVADFLTALDAAKLESSVERGPVMDAAPAVDRSTSPFEGVNNPTARSAEELRIQEMADKVGVSLDSVRSLMDEVAEELRKC